jgi:predicted nuclease of predicted toxin-antitoxin system
MKFLVDAQLPRRLARFLQSQGYDAIHTRDLPEGNATSDAYINIISIQEQRIVITKDVDFVQSFVLQQKPCKLLLIATGNIKNAELEYLFQQNLSQLVELFAVHSYIELGRDAIIIHQ